MHRAEVGKIIDAAGGLGLDVIDLVRSGLAADGTDALVAREDLAAERTPRRPVSAFCRAVIWIPIATLPR